MWSKRMGEVFDPALNHIFVITEEFLILPFLLDHENFWICFSSSITLFGSKVKRAKYTIFEKAKDLNTVILPTNERFLFCRTLRILVIFLSPPENSCYLAVFYSMRYKYQESW